MPGISAVKTGLPFSKKGFNFVQYWATRKPSDLIVTGMRDTEIDFSWADNSAGEASFKVYKSTDGVTYAADGTTVAGNTTYTATGLTAGTLYYFYVVGVKDANESDPTNIYDTYFKLTIDTTKAGSANDTFILSTYPTGTFNFYIDWGDGSAEEHITTADNPQHTYASSGSYQIKIRGTAIRIYFNNNGDKAKVIYLNNWGNIKWGSCKWMFYGCANLEANNIDVPNTSSTTDMIGMFYNCAKFNGGVGFDTANVIDMTNMFRGCTVFNKPVLSFNTAKVKAMYSMFHGCTVFNQSVVNFNTAEVTDMRFMFNGCAAFNQSVTNFNTAKVTAMESMFNGCYAFNQSVTNFDTALVTNMASMFSACVVFNQSVANFNTAAVTGTGMIYMFNNCPAFNQDLSGFNVEGVTALTNFLNLAYYFSAENYDKLLIAWALQDVNDSVDFHAGNATYSDDAAASRSHLVTATGSGGHGWTITDGGLGFDNGKLVITGDDGVDSFYTAMYPVLVAQGVSATLYITTEFIGTPGFMTLENLQTLNTAGIDLQCHGTDHTSFTSFDQAGLIAELQAVESYFTTNSLPAPVHSAYPFGQYNDNVKTWIAAERLTGRVYLSEGYITRGYDKFALKAYQGDTKNLAAMVTIIDMLKNNHLAGILAIHGIGGANQLTAQTLSDIIDYAQSVDVDIITVSQLYALMT